MAFQTPCSQIDLEKVRQQVPLILKKFAQQNSIWNGIPIRATEVSVPIFEPRYGTVKWTMGLQNEVGNYQHQITVFGSLDSTQNVNFFTLNGVKHDEFTRIFPNLDSLAEVLTLAQPILHSHPGY